MRDPLSGVRVALPFFWEVDILPEAAQDAGNAITRLRNYPLLPGGILSERGIFREGAIQINLVCLRRSIAGDKSLNRMKAFVREILEPDREEKLVAMGAIQVNGELALKVSSETRDGTEQFVVFELPDGAFLRFVPNRDAFNQPDVQAILASIALSQKAAVNRPDSKPAPPPSSFKSG